MYWRNTEYGRRTTDHGKWTIDNGRRTNNLLDQIHSAFSQFRANFDLDDCDKILRVESVTGDVDSSFLINLLNLFGFNAEILRDDDQNEMYYNSNLVLHTSMEL